jgi:hypothetical protein
MTGGEGAAVIRPVLCLLLLGVGPGLAEPLAEGGRAMLSPDAGCVAPWMRSAAPPPAEAEAPPVFRLALHRCVLDSAPPPKRRLRRT